MCVSLAGAQGGGGGLATGGGQGQGSSSGHRRPAHTNFNPPIQPTTMSGAPTRPTSGVSIGDVYMTPAQFNAMTFEDMLIVAERLAAGFMADMEKKEKEARTKASIAPSNVAKK